MKKISGKEFAWYAVAGVIIAFGIIAMVFGIVGTHLKGAYEQNFVKQFEDSINFSLRTLGIIIMAVGVVLAVIALLVNAKKADREVEKKIRREQRLVAQAATDIEVKNAVEVVEVNEETTK